MARHQRLKQKPRAVAPTPFLGERVNVVVESHGAQGDGFGNATLADGSTRPIRIPLTLRGERIKATVSGEREGRLDAGVGTIQERSPDRREPPCRHFSECGGCALQHWSEELYRAAKMERLLVDLAPLRADIGSIAPPLFTPPGSRRRVDLTVRREAARAVLGFARRRSHAVVDLAECPVALPQIVALFAPLRALAATILPRRSEAEIVVNWTDGGADILIVPPAGAELSLRHREAIAAFAERSDIARLSWGQRGKAEILLTRRPPVVNLGPVAVAPAPGGFLQASLAGEAALRGAVALWVGGARKVIDLFAGIGTLSLGLLPDRRLSLIEGNAAAVAAIDVALRRQALTGVATATRRDIERDPMPGEDLKGFDVAIVDPPKIGARAQTEALARSGVPTIVAASCNPVTFRRDAAILIAAGYRLEELRPIDQFLWSPHMELVARFTLSDER